MALWGRIFGKKVDKVIVDEVEEKIEDIPPAEISGWMSKVFDEDHFGQPSTALCHNPRSEMFNVPLTVPLTPSGSMARRLERLSTATRDLSTSSTDASESIKKLKEMFEEKNGVFKEIPFKPADLPYMDSSIISSGSVSASSIKVDALVDGSAIPTLYGKTRPSLPAGQTIRYEDGKVWIVDGYGVKHDPFSSIPDEKPVPEPEPEVMSAEDEQALNELPTFGMF